MSNRNSTERLRSQRLTRAALALLPLLGVACGRGVDGDADERSRVEREMKELITQRVDEWLKASRALALAAPVTPGRGWDAQLDADAIARMKKSWNEGRVAYELVEGAIAPLFPESDTATDARYDDYLATLGAQGDPNAFDDQGVVGMHGIERILWANEIPREVIDFETGLPGYRAAAFPATEVESRAFKEKLATKLASDVEALKKELDPLRLDVAFAFHGLIDLAAEQVEKVDRASTGQEESRYSQATLRDLRANRQGCWEAYRVFQHWVRSRPQGEALDRDLGLAFERLRRAYDATAGDAIPRPPADWSTLKPSAAHLATPFGALYKAVQQESHEATIGSLRYGLGKVADLLALPKVITK